MNRLLTVDDAAAILGTSTRFPRRLIAERRIRLVRVGRHVRIPESEIAELIAAGTVDRFVSTPRDGPDAQASLRVHPPTAVRHLPSVVR